MMNVQVDYETNELMKELKAKYGTGTMWEAVKMFIAEHLPADSVAKARARAALREQLANMGKDE